MYRESRTSIFLRSFGRSPRTRVLDLFLDNPLFEFTQPEIIEALGMAKITLYNILPSLLENGTIINTRKIGKANLYKLNMKSEAIKHIQYAIQSIATTIAQQEIQKMGILSIEKKPLIA